MFCIAPSMPMLHHLPPHVSFGFVGTRAVALDLAADRYYLISAQDAAALRGEVGDGAATHDASLDALVRRGLVRAGAGQPIAPVIATNPCVSALEIARRPGSLPVMGVAFDRGAAALWLRSRGLMRTLEKWRIVRDALAMRVTACDDDETAIGLAQAFAEARTYLPARKLCVPDSLALARLLWRKGLAADLLFGVRLSPFLAHAWVQRGDVLLSDKLNTVGDYTPVFRL